MIRKTALLLSLAIVALATARAADEPSRFTRLKYNNPGLVVDLGVGLWAWPRRIDYDGDGDLDLVVACSDVPYNGLYLFENPGGDRKLPVFKPPRRLDKGMANIQVSYVNGKPRVLTPGTEYDDFLHAALQKPKKLGPPTNIHPNKVRANQWSYVDFDGDGKVDIMVGVGDWTDYGWDNAFDAQGRWTRGPLRGYVYWLRNLGTADKPKYAEPVKVEADGKPIDLFGMPSPNFADFDGDGDLDLVCGDFIDTLTYFENVGSRTMPRYAAGRLLAHGGQPLRMDLCMITPTAIDWDGDGDVDLVVGQEDGRVALIENTGKLVDRMPQFNLPRFFQQQADDLKFGALVTPVGFDWDGDGKEDLVCGNTAGYIGFIKNLDGKDPPRWAAPQLLEAEGHPIRIMAGPNGSIQGPCEAKWGYTTLSVCDWNGDGLPDILANSIWGKVVWYRNIGTRTAPRLAPAAPVEVQWEGKPPKPAWVWWEPSAKELATQWRTTPATIDLNKDGLIDLAMLDHEGYLAWFQRARQGDQLVLLPPKRVFLGDQVSSFDASHGARVQQSGTLRLNQNSAGGSGRRKFCFADWDGDGRTDLLVNSRNASVMRCMSSQPEKYLLADSGMVDSLRLAGHDTSPTTVDWNRDGKPDLVLGAEDGCFYYLVNPHSKVRATQ